MDCQTVSRVPHPDQDSVMHLSRFPCVFLAHLPTPLELMGRLSQALGVEIWIKRDDCTGMSTGGNKTRKLEFLFGEALEQGADRNKPTSQRFGPETRTECWLRFDRSRQMGRPRKPAKPCLPPLMS